MKEQKKSKISDISYFYRQATFTWHKSGVENPTILKTKPFSASHVIQCYTYGDLKVCESRRLQPLQPPPPSERVTM
jgi:hypothetical protein